MLQHEDPRSTPEARFPQSQAPMQPVPQQQAASDQQQLLQQLTQQSQPQAQQQQQQQQPQQAPLPLPAGIQPAQLQGQPAYQFSNAVQGLTGIGPMYAAQMNAQLQVRGSYRRACLPCQGLTKAMLSVQVGAYRLCG